MENAIRRLRMIGKRLGNHAWLTFLQGLNLLKERDKRLRVVTGTVHILHAQVVSLRFKLAGEFQERHGNGQARSFVDAVSRPAVPNWA